MTILRPIFLTAALALVLVPSAQAAYAPQLAAEVTPPQTNSTAQIVTRTTQAPGETPSKTVKVIFPKGYGINLTTTIKNCPEAMAKTGDCPEDSKLGTADATAALEGFIPLKLKGSVFVAGIMGAGYRLLIVLDGSPTGRQILTGISAPGADGRLGTTFDNLPNVLTTDLTLTLFGGPKSLVRTSLDCGEGIFDAEFTSQKGEKASGQFKLSVAGCRPGLFKFAPLAVKAGKARFRLNEPASVRARFFRGGKLQATKTVKGKAGINSFKLPAKIKKAGDYTIRFRATATNTLGNRFAEDERDFTIKKKKARRS